jgi:hypothetical protein
MDCFRNIFTIARVAKMTVEFVLQVTIERTF